MTSEPFKKSNNVSGLSRNDEVIDSRVSFEYHLSPQPSKIDGKGNKWYLFRLFISPKSKFALNNIKKVVYLLPSSFDPQNVASQDPRSQFSIELEALGGFYVMAVILKNTGEKLKLSQYLPNGSVVTDPSIISTDPAAYWTDFAMKQAQKWTSLEGKLFGSEQSKHLSEQESPS
jgi:hypothetical protein